MGRPPDADAVIIGAGIIGAAIALELGKLGYKTINVDKLPAAGYGPTSNSCGIVRTHYSSADGVVMAREGTAIWQQWESYLGLSDAASLARYVNCGVVQLKSNSGHWVKVLQHYRSLGVEHEEWDTAELAKRLPVFDTHTYWPPKRPDDAEFMASSDGELEGAIFTPQGGYVSDTQLATQNVKSAAEALGGTFLFNAEVAEIRSDDSRVEGVTLRDGQRIEAHVVVNVAGPHSFVLNQMAGVESEMNVKTRALRVEVHHVPSPAGFDFERDGCVVSDGDLGIYFRPAPGNNILVGSEDPPCDVREWIDDPSNYDRQVTASQWQAQVYRLARRIPTLPIPNDRKGVVDLYDVSDDWIPVYDKSALPGFYMAIGSSGNQFKTAPVAGRLMAQLIHEVEQGRDNDTDPVRIACKYSDGELDAGAYSRLRTVNSDSSFSVLG